MSKNSKKQTLSGRLQQILFSPKGGLEGLLIAAHDAVVQVSMEPATADAAALTEALGAEIEVTATADHSPKTKASAHPVFKLDTLVRVGGKAFKTNGGGNGPVRGVVASIHYARHGEPNGVVLESGEFIHTRPHGMKRLKLAVGMKVVARGKRRQTVLGTALIEAHEVNRVTIE